MRVDDEKKEKKRQKVFITGAITAYSIATYTCFHVAADMHVNPRLSLSDALSPIRFLEHPLAVFPVSGQFVFGFISITILGGLLAYMQHNINIMKKHDNPDTVNGDAHWMTGEELKEFDLHRTDPIGKEGHDGFYNMILAQDLRLSLDGRKCFRNANVLVLGGSGSGKSRYFASPNILQYNSNFLITDPSGELLNDYGKSLEDNGYKVSVLNIVNPYEGSRYNPFRYIHSEEDAFVLVKTIMANTVSKDQKGGEVFWDQTTELLLNAIILYIWNVLPPEQQNFAKVLELINEADVDENDPDNAKSKLDLKFEELESEKVGGREEKYNLAVYNYKLFKKGAGKTLKSIIISAGARLFPFELPKIQYLTSEDDFDFDHFADRKQAVFVIIPTGDTSFNFLVSTFYTQLFMRLFGVVEHGIQWSYKITVGTDPYAETLRVYHGQRDTQEKAKEDAENFTKTVKNEGLKLAWNDKRKYFEIRTKKSNELVAWRGTKAMAVQFADKIMKEGLHAEVCKRMLPNHVRFILDEFANIGQIPNFQERLATIRKYSISADIILQTRSQLKSIYKDDMDSIIGNCDTVLFLGNKDMDTCKWLSDSLGERTTTVMNTSWSSDSKGGGGNTSYNKSKIALMPVNKVMQINDDECVVMIRGKIMPYFGKKYELTKHPNYKYAMETAGKFVIPVPEGIEVYDPRPFRERKRAFEEAKKNKPPVTPTVTEKTQQEVEEEKKQKEKTAQQAEKAKTELDNSTLRDKPEQVAADLNNAMGVNVGDSKETIDDKVSGTIVLRNMDKETFERALAI